MPVRARNTERKRTGRGLRQRGVILLETLVGVAVISTTVLTGLVALSTANIASDQGANTATASWIIVSEIESISTQNYVSIGSSYTDVTTPTGFTVQNTTTAYPGGNANVQIVTITVSKDGDALQSKQIVKVNR